MDAYVGSLLIAPYPHLHPRRKKKIPFPANAHGGTFIPISIPAWIIFYREEPVPITKYNVWRAKANSRRQININCAGRFLVLFPNYQGYCFETLFPLNEKTPVEKKYKLRHLF